MTEARLKEIEEHFSSDTPRENLDLRMVDELIDALRCAWADWDVETADWYERAKLAQQCAGELKEEIRRLRRLMLEATSPPPPQQRPEPLPAPSGTK